MISVQTGKLYLREFLRDSFWDLCFFYIYINDLPHGLRSNVKFFADGTSLFSVVKNKEGSNSDTLIRFPNGDTAGKFCSIQTQKNRSRGIILWKKLKYNPSNYLFQQCLGTKS